MAHHCGNNPVMFVDPWGLLETSDGQYNSQTQLKLIEYTCKYYIYNVPFGDVHKMALFCEVERVPKNVRP